MLGEGSHPIEIVGTNKELVPCFVEPRLSSQVSQDFSRVPVFLAFRWRRKNFDHVDFPQSADQAEKTHVSDISSRPGGPVHASLRHPVQPCPDPRRRPTPSGEQRFWTRTEKRCSAIVTISRALPGIPCSLFVLRKTAMPASS